MNANERKCPYCAEIIKNEALKCKHCGSSLKVTVMTDFFNNKKNSVKKRYWFLFLAILVAMFLTNPDKTDFNHEIVKRIQNSEKANNTKPIEKITSGFKSLAISAMTVRNNYIFFSVFKTDNSLLRIIDPKTPKLKFLGIFGEVIPLFSTDTELSETKEKLKSSVDEKIKEVEKLNDACRGGSGDDPSTFKACDKRDNGIIELRKMGWCYGDDSQAEYEKKWQKCSDLKSVKKNYSNYSDKKTFLARHEFQEQIKQKIIELEKFRAPINLDGNTRANIAAEQRYKTELTRVQSDLVGKKVNNWVCRLTTGNVNTSWDQSISNQNSLSCYGNVDNRRFGNLKDDENYSLTISKASSEEFDGKIYDGDQITFSAEIVSIFPAPVSGISFQLNLKDAVIHSSSEPV